jgi:hypothetical protein
MKTVHAEECNEREESKSSGLEFTVAATNIFHTSLDKLKAVEYLHRSPARKQCLGLHLGHPVPGGYK